MKTNVALLGLLILAMAAFFSCKKDNQKNSVSNNIAYDSISIAKTYQLDNDSTKPSCSLRISYIFPVKYEDGAVLTLLQKELNFVLLEDEKYEALKPKDAVNLYIEDYIATYKRDIQEQYAAWEESGETEDYFSYFKTLRTRVVFDMDNILSYQISSMDYRGGANSSTAFRNIVIDLKTGKMLNEQDIYISDYRGVLNSLLIDKIVRQNKLNKPEDLLDIGYWGIEDLSTNGNFYADNKGLTYIFNPGEYSAPTLGEIQVFLPYDEIKDILNESSPISKFID